MLVSQFIDMLETAIRKGEREMLYYVHGSKGDHAQFGVNVGKAPGNPIVRTTDTKPVCMLVSNDPTTWMSPKLFTLAEAATAYEAFEAACGPITEIQATDMHTDVSSTVFAA